tara:strand:+ start:37 stop:252 length:216 start_codon:yes stop_codon:yes gene_type:complete
VLAFNKTTEITELYVLSKPEMEQEVKLSGRLAHGVSQNQKQYSHPEYAVRFKENSPEHQRWQQYRKPVTWV